MRWIELTKDLSLSLFLSLEIKIPLLFINCPMYVVFPPGAAVKSNIRSVSFGLSDRTGSKEAML